MLPNVVIKLENGGLGRITSTSDGIAGICVTGKAEGSVELNKPFIITSVADIKRNQITETENSLLIDSIKEFYATAGDGSTLYIVVVADTTTLTAMCSGVTSPVGKMLEGANGKIRLVAINKKPASSYTPTVQKCLDEDAINAVMAMQTLAGDMQGKVMPFRAFVPAYGWSGETTGIYAPNESTSPNVGMVISATENGNAAVSRILGRASRESVSTSIARVASGQIANSAKWTDGESFNVHASEVEILHNAGYIFYRTFPTRNGYYLNDDGMAAPSTDDHQLLNIGRTVDKALVTAYSTYLEFVNESVAIDSKGKIVEGAAKHIENTIENAIGNAMYGEISSVNAVLNREIDTLATSTIEVALDIVPKGTIKHINVLLKMSNPNIQ